MRHTDENWQELALEALKGVLDTQWGEYVIAANSRYGEMVKVLPQDKITREERVKLISDVESLDKIPEYGIYKTLSGDAVRTVVDWMISEHYILKTKGKYPVLHSTYEGLHYSESITEGKLKKLKIQLEGNKMPFDM